MSFQIAEGALWLVPTEVALDDFSKLSGMLAKANVPTTTSGKPEFG